MIPGAHEKIAERKLFAGKLIQACALCPCRCGVNRAAGEKGFCGLDGHAYCFREMLHPDEERELSPSHQIYFSGCNLRCEYCTVAEWNESPDQVDAIGLDELADRIRQRRQEGARTLNFLGGEPAVNLVGILDLLERLDPSITVVWNSNMYYCKEVDEILRGLVDVFLADVKCGNAECSEKILGASDYFPVAIDMVKRAARHADVIVRHLVLPGHLDCCCRPVLQWLAEDLPNVKVSLRLDYIPPAECLHSPGRYLSSEEANEALAIAREMQLNLVT